MFTRSDGCTTKRWMYHEVHQAHEEDDVRLDRAETEGRRLVEPAPSRVGITQTLPPGWYIRESGYATGRFAAASASRLSACTSGHEHDLPIPSSTRLQYGHRWQPRLKCHRLRTVQQSAHTPAPARTAGATEWSNASVNCHHRIGSRAEASRNHTIPMRTPTKPRTNETSAVVSI